MPDNGLVFVQMQRQNPQAELLPMNVTREPETAETWLARGYVVRRYIYECDVRPAAGQKGGPDA
jgi:hypothetical protein